MDAESPRIVWDSLRIWQPKRAYLLSRALQSQHVSTCLNMSQPCSALHWATLLHGKWLSEAKASPEMTAYLKCHLRSTTSGLFKLFLGSSLNSIISKPEIGWRRGNKKLWASGVRRCTSAIAMESPGGTQPHTHTHMKAAMSWRWVMIQLRYNHMKTLKEKRSLDHAKWLIRIIN